MNKHTPAEVKLHVNKEVQPVPKAKKLTPPKDNSAPQVPSVKTNAKNQYR